MKMNFCYKDMGLWSVKYRLSVVTFLFFIPSLAIGQIKITADTLLKPFTYSGRLKTDKLVIDSRQKYDETEFLNDGEPCVPFNEIDFDRSILVGYRYQGSNCERSVQWSTIIETDKGYLIQFSTMPNHVCRDIHYPIAWFVIDRPQGEFEIAFERVTKR